MPEGRFESHVDVVRHVAFTHLQEIKGAKKGLLDTEQAAETASARAEASLI